MPSAPVTADTMLAVARRYADQVHDAVRRTGCQDGEASGVVRQAATDLLDALQDRPAEVGDLAAFWFRRAIELAHEREPADAGQTEAGLEAGEDERVLKAIDRLPADQRDVLRLRDVYRLPSSAVAVAAGRPPAEIDRDLASARLAFVAAYADGSPSRPSTWPDARAGLGTASGGDGHAPDLATLSRLADGSLPTAEAAALRHHVYRCRQCDQVADRLARAHQMLAALPLLALTDDERDQLLAGVTTRAESALRSLEDVLLSDEPASGGEPPLIPLTIIALCLVAAVVVGVVLGILMTP